jgi:hypothetical protein
MPEIPEVILVPLTRLEAVLVVDALSRLQVKQGDQTDEQKNMYNRVVEKISALLDDDQSKSPLHIVR